MGQWCNSRGTYKEELEKSQNMMKESVSGARGSGRKNSEAERFGEGSGSAEDHKLLRICDPFATWLLARSPWHDHMRHAHAASMLTPHA